MLRKETVTAGTLELLNQLMLDENLIDFFLVGGTALSLQIGHRISIDIDLFSQTSFDENKMLEYLESVYDFKLDYLAKNTVKGQIGETKIDLITHSYPFTEKVQLVDGIRIASLGDIAAMKLNAIVSNGTRLKDFIDVAFLSSCLSLKTMMDAYEDKYTTRNPALTIKSLSYFKDVDFSERIQMIDRKYSWKSIEKRIGEMIEYPEKVFAKHP